MLEWLFTYSEADMKSRREDQKKFHRIGDERVAESEMLRGEYVKLERALHRPKVFYGEVRWETKRLLGFRLWKHNQSTYQYTFHHTKANSLQSVLDIIERS